MKDLVSIRRFDSHIELGFADSSSESLSAELLRKNCPCADCNLKRGVDTHSSPLTPKKTRLRVIEHSAEEACSLLEVWPVGGYGIGIKFMDGHASGIFNFDLLERLLGLGGERSA